ncbi:hypothetical protein NVIRPANT_00734 [Pantoea sp. Nvir]|nr:hypothetical protein NVIRPANT_00734 [Pantoea sp. Nvir]
MRSIWKQIYRYTHPRSYRHNENLWPHVRIGRAPEGHINSLDWKGRKIVLEDLSALHASHQDSLVIIATGPSVKILDLKKLAHFKALGVNGAYYLCDSIKFYYYVIIDRDFVKYRHEVVHRIIQDQNLILFITIHCLHDIFITMGCDTIKCRITIVEDIRYKVFQAHVTLANYAKKSHLLSGMSLAPGNNNIGFCQDIRQGVIDAATVSYWALQIAYYLGARTIFIAGVDMTNFSAPRFYENETDIMQNSLESSFQSLIKPSFLHSSRIMQKENVVVYNLSPNSALGSEIFKKILLNDT